MPAIDGKYVDEGLRVVLADDWFIWVVDESTGLVWNYVTELWPEWLDVPEGAPITAMIPHAHNYRPRPELSAAGEHMTLERFLACDW